MPPIGAEHRKIKWRRGRPPRRGVLRSEWPGSPLQSRGDGGPEGQNQGAYPNGHVTAMARTAGRRTAARRAGKEQRARAVGETPTVVSDDGEGGVGSNGGGERGA